ncbi:TPA: hypothetical protein ACYSLL_004157 [Salmonella enterica]|uniref:hypothetical protein n=1 Tax=unclassified Salmonella TaxID=2614656 RepID=UPI003F426355
MSYRLVCTTALVLSFSNVAAESHEDLTRTVSPAHRDTKLVCKGELISGSSITELSREAYLEGVGEQILFAIIPTSKSDEYLQAFFNAWGFSPFGQVESREQFHSWSLIHLGRHNLVRGRVSDYTFVDATPQSGADYQQRSSVRLYDCQNQNERPDWTQQKFATQKHFNGDVY